MNNNSEYTFYVICSNERPPFGAIPIFLWGHDREFDSDGNASYPESGTWTELHVSLRDGEETDFVDVSPHQSIPLILEITSPSLVLASCVAFIISYYTDGEIKQAAHGIGINKDDFAKSIELEFPLQTAILRFEDAVKEQLSKRNRGSHL